MANLVYIEPGTTLKINGEGDADYAWSMESLANGAGWVSIRIDLGAPPRADRYEWLCKVLWKANPTQSNLLELYLSEWGQSTTNSAGDVGATDGALSDADQRRNLFRFGQVVAEDAATTAMVAMGEIWTPSRYISLVGWNAGGAEINDTDSNFLFELTPIPNEIQ